MWFVKRHHSKTWRVRNGVSVQFVAGSSVVLKVARNGCRVGLRLFDRLAAVAHFDLPQLVVMCEDGFRQLVQEASTFNRGKLTPCAAARGLAGVGWAALARRSTQPAGIFARTGPQQSFTME